MPRLLPLAILLSLSACTALDDFGKFQFPDATVDGSADSGDVGPDAPACVPSMDGEVCNGLDDDCNGLPDEGDICGPGLSCVMGECVDCEPGIPDPPDVDFYDANCDGIDGDFDSAIFVAPGAAPGGDGRTPDAPLASIQAGIDAAINATRSEVYIAAGEYTESEPVRLASGISLYGGYDATFTSRSDAATVLHGATTAVLGERLSSDVELQLLTIESATATTPGESSYVIRVIDSPGMIRIVACELFAGDGAPGEGGASGSSGAMGNVGDPGMDGEDRLGAGLSGQAGGRR